MLIIGTAAFLDSLLILIETLGDIAPFLRHVAPFPTEEAIEIIIGTIFGMCLGLCSVIETTIYGNALIIDFGSKYTCSIITPLF